MAGQQDDDQNAGFTKALFAFLPFMVGWFALNVPSGLSLYYFANTSSLAVSRSGSASSAVCASSSLPQCFSVHAAFAVTMATPRKLESWSSSLYAGAQSGTDLRTYRVC